jgi:hypothetical protein
MPGSAEARVTARSRSNKAQPVEDKPITFTIVIDAQEIVVSYRPHWMQHVGHFEFTSPHKPRRPIPISETGYLSHFANMKDIETATSPQDVASDAALALLRSENRQQLRVFC